MTGLRLGALRDAVSPDFSYSQSYLSLLSAAGCMTGIICCASIPLWNLITRTMKCAVSRGKQEKGLDIYVGNSKKRTITIGKEGSGLAKPRDVVAGWLPSSRRRATRPSSELYTFDGIIDPRIPPTYAVPVDESRLVLNDDDDGLLARLPQISRSSTAELINEFPPSSSGSSVDGGEKYRQSAQSAVRSDVGQLSEEEYQRQMLHFAIHNAEFRRVIRFQLIPIGNTDGLS